MIKTTNTVQEFQIIVMEDLKSHNILTQKAKLDSGCFWYGDAQCSNSGYTELIDYKASITFMVFEGETTINKIKGIAKYRPLYTQFKAIRTFWSMDNTIVYCYDSWYHTYEEHNPNPYNGFPKVWGWSDDDVKTMPDVWKDELLSDNGKHIIYAGEFQYTPDLISKKDPKTFENYLIKLNAGLKQSKAEQKIRFINEDFK